MKKALVAVIFMVCGTAACAQRNFKELIARIVLLQVYLGYLQKGYSVAKDGLAIIGDIKNGEFNLHQNYFSSLKNVNPKIKGFAKVANIMLLQTRLIEQYKRAFRSAKECGRFTVGELDYMYRVYMNLLAETQKDVELLIAVTTNNELQMKDDQRLQQIDRLYSSVQDRYGFLTAFNNDLNVLFVQRMREEHDIRSVKEAYQIK